MGMIKLPFLNDLVIDAFFVQYFAQFFLITLDPLKFAGDLPAQDHQMKVVFLEKWQFTPLLRVHCLNVLVRVLPSQSCFIIIIRKLTTTIDNYFKACIMSSIKS